ncbi:GNAT family N-acetyltransferase [Streptomyces niger]|uniref:GNAT family N-acetyltransferase n=1 Tax=Streptomyces niger TaxID=66373 RepID=UPI00069A4D09|nr:GNAT family N-acetyltransferase [Streptomyces niger]
MGGQVPAESLEARPLREDSAPAWLELHHAVERADATGEHADTEEFLEVLADPKLDPDRDSLGLWDGPRLVAYAVLHTPHGALDAARFQGDAQVHPGWRHRGIGDRLFAWLEERAQARQAADAELSGLRGELLLEGMADQEDLAKLAERRGFTPCRWWFRMKQPLDGGRPEPRPAPEGTRLVTYEAAYSEATRLAHNDAFRDHWNFTPFDETDWQTWVTGAKAFRPAMSRLLVTDEGVADKEVADKEVAAYLLAEESTAETAATGSRDCHVGYLGTRRAYRGRGAAPALLREVLRTARDAGYDTVSLTVDTANPSGALGFYEESGFVVERETVTYTRPLAASRPS